MEQSTIPQESDHVQSFIIDQANQSQIQTGEWTNLIHGTRFVSNGKYVCGYVDSSQDLVQLLDNYRSITGTSFTSNQNLVQAIKNIDESQLQMRFVTPASRPRLFWQMNAGEPTIQYDGVPFMSIGHGTDLPCARFGGRRKKIEQVSLPSGDVVPVDYRMKTGCEAKITIRRILRYPCAEYNETMIQGIAAVRRHRKQILDDLVQRIISGTAKAQERFHFLLPTPLAHNGHMVSDIEGPLPIGQQVLDEIVSQLSNGVTSIVQLQDRVKNFVVTTYGTDPGSIHSGDPTFCLSEFDIFRQVYWLYKMGQVIDQESNFKSSIGLSGIEQALSQAVNQRNSNLGVVDRKPTQATNPPPVSTPSSSSSADPITSVYSIIMENGSTSDGTSPLGQLAADHMSTEQEVELNSTESSGSHGLGVMEQSSMVSQMQIAAEMNSPIITVSSQQQQQQQAGLQGNGHHANHSNNITPKQPHQHVQQHQSTPILMKMPAAKSIITSPSNFNYRASSGTPPAEEDETVTQAQTEVLNMLRIIENQSHACKNLSALNTLRRQLTELCGQFSMFLAGVPSLEFSSSGPPAKRQKN